MTSSNNDRGPFETPSNDEVSGKIDGLDQAMETDPEVLEQETMGPVDVAGSSGTEGLQTYTVQPGDDLRQIAQRFYGQEGEYIRIIEANRDELGDSETVRPGLQLTIPR
ncbi:MAG: LysM peptidoglycan-binding domain-containing protein [Dehalococcoidia bacterium]